MSRGSLVQRPLSPEPPAPGAAPAGDGTHALPGPTKGAPFSFVPVICAILGFALVALIVLGVLRYMVFTRVRARTEGGSSAQPQDLAAQSLAGRMQSILVLHPANEVVYGRKMDVQPKAEPPDRAKKAKADAGSPKPLEVELV